MGLRLAAAAERWRSAVSWPPETSTSKLDVAKEQIAYLKLWLGIVIVTDISLVGWLLGNFRSVEWPLIVGNLLALLGVAWGCYALHTRIESAIAKLEELQPWTSLSLSSFVQVRVS